MTSDNNKSKAKTETVNVVEIRSKIDLIEKGLPVNITEGELQDLELILRNARSFYIDILEPLSDRKDKGEVSDSVEENIMEESINIAGVDLALRKIDEFRAAHKSQIKGNK
jgi:hypothetical protein